MPKYLTTLLFSLLGLFLLSSCNDTFTLCEQSRISTINGSFFSISTGSEVMIVPPSLNVSILNGPEIITNSPNQGTFLLPLNPGLDSIAYVMRTSAGGVLDTVSFKYTTQEVQLSEECGKINQYTITTASTTKNNFDSIAVIQSLADTKLSRNIKIYY